MMVSRDVTSNSPQQAGANRCTDFALVVGVDHYPRFRPLSGAVADAVAFHEWLCSPEGGGVDAANARLVVSRPDPLAPLQDEIDEQLMDLVASADAIGGGRRLYFHFSGHGAMSPNESGEDVALLLAKWSRVMVRLALSTDEYRDALGVLGLFDEVAIFLDCCRATADYVVGLPPTFRFAPRTVRCATRTFIAYATEAGHSAFEVRNDHVSQGVFTRSLLAILRRASHGIDAAALKREIELEVATRGQQAHIVNGLRDGSIFGTRGVLPRLEVRFATAAGRARLLNGHNVVIAERDVGSEPWLLSLEAGLYKLEHSAGPATLIDHGREDVTRVVVGAQAGSVTLRETTPTQPCAFQVTSEASVRITVYDASGASVMSSEGALRSQLATGLYRLHFERGGVVSERLIDHDGYTDLDDKGPPLLTPAPMNGAVTSNEQLASSARTFSTTDSCPPLGDPPFTSRLFVFIRRHSRNRGPRALPSEPMTIHDLVGRRLTTVCRNTSHLDNELGYIAFSGRVAPGVYRLRAVRSRRDIAITIPPHRAAHVFVADRGSLAMDDLRVSLVPVDQSYDPENRCGRSTETSILALRSPRRDLPRSLRELSPDETDEDLCLGIAIAHLAWKTRDHATFDRVMNRLHIHGAIPDVAILDRAASQASASEPFAALMVPPLFRASLSLALTHPAFGGDVIAPGSPCEQATRAPYSDSIWCTWSARSWDERWIEPTIEALRQRDPHDDITLLARRVRLSPRTVERTIDGLDSTLPLVNGAPVRLEQIRVPGYTIGDVLGRGGQGVVFQATRDTDHHAVAIKVVPLIGRAAQRIRVQRELDLMQRLQHPRLLGVTAHGSLPNDVGLWLEMERCRGSAMDLVAEPDAPMPANQACQVVLGALDGLAFLHANGVVHRDIKPGNLLVRTDGHALIGDLGLGKALLDGGQLTATGSVAGTVRFAPPEQLIDFKRATYASDVWSMAATLYFLLTLEFPREEFTDQTELEAALDNPIVPIRERSPQLPERLAQCIDRALAREIHARPHDGAALSGELRAAL
jgi:hypothetical protein